MFDVSLFVADLQEAYDKKDWKLIKAILASLSEYESDHDCCGSEGDETENEKTS